ncbi:MAG: hypothetical protein ACI4F0_04300 [Agathobacter sp.]
MEKFVEEFHSFLANCKETVAKQVEELVSDDRADEARPLRAKANIYDVFCTLFDVAYKQSQGDCQVCREKFLKQAENIPANWKKSLEEAKAHEDMEKVLIEEAKLSAVTEIVEHFEMMYKSV